MKRLAVAALMCAAISAPAVAEEYKWGAIAIDTEKAEKDPAWGTGGAETEQEASDTALGFCKEAGGVTCKVIVTYEQCGALAVNGKGNAGWGKAPDKDGAEKGAMSACEDAAECKVVVSDCNGG